MERQNILFSNPNNTYEAIISTITKPIEMNNPLGVILGYYVVISPDEKKAIQIALKIIEKKEDNMTIVDLIRYIQYFKDNPPLLDTRGPATTNEYIEVRSTPVTVSTVCPQRGETEDYFRYTLYYLIKNYSAKDY